MSSLLSFTFPEQDVCRHLSLSTNNIEKISNLVGLENLKILSLGRNIIKKLEALDPVAPTLEELWISYNLLEKFVGLFPPPPFIEASPT